MLCMLPCISRTIYDGLVSTFSLCPEVSQHVFSRTWDILLPNHSKVTEIRKFNIDTESFIFICKCVSYHAPPICPGSKPEFHGLYYFLIRNTKQLFKKLFLCEPFLKPLYWICYKIASILCSACFGPKACRILAPPPGAGPHPWHYKATS